MVSKTKGTVLVTGAAKRIGAHVALHLARLGYGIALHYHRSKIEAMSTAQAIYKTGVPCELFCCDLADESQILKLAPQVFKAFPNFNVLINSASIFIPNQFGAGDLSLFKAHWNTNFKAPYILTCEFARLVKSGQVINFVDANVIKYKTKYADYMMTKKALMEFTKMAAVQWGPRIRVNGISPGMILAPVNNQPDDRIKRARKIPLQKIGNARNIMQSVQFLLENDFLTGQIITNDGGESLI
ncbi:MAG: SDR family oxidoreductase [Candidatus Omnitrophica bacterium]|nr:SDR family oxidoreductase [Candidatus Omnitrophota bacterium]